MTTKFFVKNADGKFLDTWGGNRVEWKDAAVYGDTYYSEQDAKEKIATLGLENCEVVAVESKSERWSVSETVGRPDEYVSPERHQRAIDDERNKRRNWDSL